MVLNGIDDVAFCIVLPLLLTGDDSLWLDAEAAVAGVSVEGPAVIVTGKDVIWS